MHKFYLWRPCALLVILGAVLANPVQATDIEIEETLPDSGKRSLLIPYAFYNDNTEGNATASPPVIEYRC